MPSADLYKGFIQGVEDAGFLKELEDEFRTGWNREENMAFKEQAEVASVQQERRFIDGIGQCTMSIHPTAYHYWGQRLGYGCWRDKQFRKEFARDNPSVRVKSRSAKTKVSMANTDRPKKAIVRSGATLEKVRFKKSYDF